MEHGSIVEQRSRTAGMRSRWAAIGAAVAVTLGAGGIGLVSAAASTGGPVLVSITPCRLLDTRPDTVVGGRPAPLGPGETYTLTAVGDSGDCAGIPADAVALSMNVTGVAATDLTFLTVFPAGAPRPDASNLNLAPGAAATPNAVVSGLGGGQLSIYNLQGSTHVIVDVNGYYVDHHHDDRYVRIPTEEVVIHPFDMQPATSAASGWTRTFFWAHAASATSECLATTVDLPPGRPLAGMTVLYAASAPASVTAGLLALAESAGPLVFAAETSTGTATAPASPGAQVAEVFVPFIQGRTSVDGVRYLAVVCTDDVFGLAGASVSLV